MFGKKDKKLLKRVLIGCVVLFIVIFLCRLAYQLVEPADGGVVRQEMLLGEGRSIVNYASSKMAYDDTFTGTSHVVEQKYEKTAALTSKTTRYDEDEASVYAILESNQCVVQLENKSGLDGFRRISLVIGVKPDRFDDTVRKIAGVGRIVSRNVTRTDKTNDYRQMLADKATLEKTRESYVALRAKSGNITELLALEQRIIEIEGQIQSQSVNLGEYSDENSFCTINFVMDENASAGAVSVLLLVWRAFVWSLKCYAAILAVLLLTMLFAAVSVKAYGFVKKLFNKTPSAF